MNAKDIEALIDFIAKSKLEEVAIETDQIKLTVRRSSPMLTTFKEPIQAPSPGSTPDTTSEAKALVTVEDRYVAIKAPMVGTFYQAPNADVPPFVQVGDKISIGQKICIIEAMKLFNEIESDVAGTVVKILINDTAPVEYDQPLFLIDPAS